MNKVTLAVNAPAATFKQFPEFPALPRESKSRVCWLFILRRHASLIAKLTILVKFYF